MKSLIFTAIFSLLLAGFGADHGLAQWRIELQNGNHIMVEQYWLERDQIAFMHGGGKVGVPKELVADIVALQREEDQKPIGLNDTADESSHQDFQTTFDVDTHYQNELLRINSALLQLSEKYTQAVSDQDNFTATQTVKEMDTYQLRQEVLRQQVLHANNNTLPEWWDEIVYGNASP